MPSLVDTSFEFHSDSPPGKDPDQHSPTLRTYHRLLWSKPLPSGTQFELLPEPGSYLVHRSSRGMFDLTSDAITMRLLGRAWRIIAEIPADSQPEDLGYTIGSAILFPGNKVDERPTINGARGLHPRIADRFDLTLECIRRHYRDEPSPLAETLARYADFFALFEDFNGYVEFFLLQDLLDRDGEIRFFHPFANFTTPAVPRTAEDYLAYVRASNAFIRGRNRRIDAAKFGNGFAGPSTAAAQLDPPEGTVPAG